MLSKFKPKSEFSKNILTLMTGTSIAQAIPIAISPILTRMYTPEDFGVYALFVSIVAIFAVMVSGKYELAILLPKDDKDAYGILVLSIILTLISSSFLFFIFYIFNLEILSLLGTDQIGFLLYFIPISIFMTSFFSILVQYNNRIKNYKDIANANIAKSLMGAFIQLLIGAIKASPMGLIAGQISSSFVANFKLMFNLKNDKNIYHEKIDFLQLLKLAKRYINFPKYTLPSSLLETISSKLPVILFGSLFNMSVVGYFMLSQRIVRMPMSLLGNSVTMVFQQEASKDFINFGNCKKLYLRTLKKLLFIGFPPFILLSIFSPFLFSSIFGEEWKQAGEYTQILSVVYYLQFISSPLGTIFYIAEKQKVDLYIQIFVIIIMISALFIGRYVFNSIEITLYLFATVYSIKYLIEIILAYGFSKGEK